MSFNTKLRSQYQTSKLNMSSTKKSGKGKGKASNNEEGKGGSITSFFGPKNSTTTNAVPSSSTAKKSGTSTARKAQCKLDSTTSTNGGCGRDYLHNRNNTALKTSLSRLNNHTFQQNNLLRDDTAGVPFHPEVCIVYYYCCCLC